MIFTVIYTNKGVTVKKHPIRCVDLFRTKLHFWRYFAW